MHETQFAKTVAWLLRIQALLTGLCGVTFAMLGGLGPALAALAGGAIGVFLTVLTALRTGLSINQEPRVMVRSFYRAMALKFVLAVVVFVIVAIWFSGYFVPVIAGYAATTVAYWLAMQRLAHLPGSTTDNEKRDSV